jgi:hypothetical protein
MPFPGKIGAVLPMARVQLSVTHTRRWAGTADRTIPLVDGTSFRKQCAPARRPCKLTRKMDDSWLCADSCKVFSCLATRFSFFEHSCCARLSSRSLDGCATADAWNFGLCATKSREPRQARKGATVPGSLRAPRSTRSSSHLQRASMLIGCGLYLQPARAMVCETLRTLRRVFEFQRRGPRKRREEYEKRPGPTE